MTERAAVVVEKKPGNRKKRTNRRTGGGGGAMGAKNKAIDHLTHVRNERRREKRL